MLFFVTSSTKLGRFRWNLVYGFLNNFAAESRKRFPAHPNNVSTLPCETWNANCARATIDWVVTAVTPEFIQPHLWPLNSPDLNPVDNSVWMILQEKIYETRINDLETGAIDDVTDEWLPQWRHYPAWPTPLSVAVSVHPDQWCVFCTPSLAVFPHAVINWIQIWRI